MYAVVETSPVESASKTKEDSILPWPEPPKSLRTYRPPKPRPALLRITSIGKCSSLSHCGEIQQSETENEAQRPVSMRVGNDIRRVNINVD